TVTGLVPSPLGPQEACTAPASQRQGARACPTAPEPTAEEVITQLVRHTRYLLTLKGRPPLRLAAMDTYTPLDHVPRFTLDLLATHYVPRLAQLYRGLRSSFSHFAETYQAFHQGAAWLRDIAYILEPTTTQALRGEQVAEQLRGYLDTMLHLPPVTPALYEL